jgi:uncharacterized protein (TIGR02466 family)
VSQPGDPFTPRELFSWPLYTSVITGHEQHRDGLLAVIYEHRSKHPGVRRSNRNAWHSGDELYAVRDPHVDWLLAKVTAFARRALAPLHGDWATSELTLTSYWANVLGPGGWNAPHHHYPTHWSGVYYVSVPGIGSGVEDMSGLVEFINPMPWSATFGRTGNFATGPKPGMLFLWPAPLLHFVHPHAGPEDRVSIAYNLTVTPKASAVRRGP